MTEGRYPGKVTYHIYMATGSDGRFEEQASYHAIHESSSSPEIRVIGRTERELTETGCAVLSLAREDDDDSVHDENVFFRLTIARGIDPALFICFAAFIDEAIEKLMRTQSIGVKENVYKLATSTSSR